MAKKIFLASGITFFIIIATLFVYRFFIYSQTKGPGPFVFDSLKNDESMVEMEQKKEIETKITKVTEKIVAGAKVFENKEALVYYESQNFITSDFDGLTRKTVGAYPFLKVKSIQWSSKKNQAIVDDNGSIFIYDLGDNSAIELKDVDVAIWDAFGERVVYKYFDSQTNKRKIATSKDGNREEEVLVDDVPFMKVDLLAIPKSNTVCYFPSPEARTESSLNCVDIKSGNKKMITSGLYGADYLFSPDGKKILISHLVEKSPNRLNLAIMSSLGGEFTGLNFYTSVKKCLWSKDSKNIFCGAMTDIPDYAVLPNDWWTGKHFSVDTFWKIETSTSQKQRIVELEDIPAKMDGEYFFTDEKEKNMFFTDRQSGNLYRIRF